MGFNVSYPDPGKRNEDLQGIDLYENDDKNAEKLRQMKSFVEDSLRQFGDIVNLVPEDGDYPQEGPFNNAQKYLARKANKAIANIRAKLENLEKEHAENINKANNNHDLIEAENKRYNERKAKLNLDLSFINRATKPTNNIVALDGEQEVVETRFPFDLSIMWKTIQAMKKYMSVEANDYGKAKTCWNIINKNMDYYSKLDETMHSEFPNLNSVYNMTNALNAVLRNDNNYDDLGDDEPELLAKISDKMNNVLNRANAFTQHREIMEKAEEGQLGLAESILQLDEDIQNYKGTAAAILDNKNVDFYSVENDLVEATNIHTAKLAEIESIKENIRLAGENNKNEIEKNNKLKEEYTKLALDKGEEIEKLNTEFSKKMGMKYGPNEIVNFKATYNKYKNAIDARNLSLLAASSLETLENSLKDINGAAVTNNKLIDQNNDLIKKLQRQENEIRILGGLKNTLSTVVLPNNEAAGLSLQEYDDYAIDCFVKSKKETIENNIKKDAEMLDGMKLNSGIRIDNASVLKTINNAQIGAAIKSFQEELAKKEEILTNQERIIAEVEKDQSEVNRIKDSIEIDRDHKKQQEENLNALLRKEIESLMYKNTTRNIAQLGFVDLNQCGLKDIDEWAKALKEGTQNYNGVANESLEAIKSAVSFVQLLYADNHYKNKDEIAADSDKFNTFKNLIDDCKKYYGDKKNSKRYESAREQLLREIKSANKRTSDATDIIQANEFDENKKKYENYIKYYDDTINKKTQSLNTLENALNQKKANVLKDANGNLLTSEQLNEDITKLADISGRIQKNITAFLTEKDVAGVLENIKFAADQVYLKNNHLKPENIANQDKQKYDLLEKNLTDCINSYNENGDSEAYTAAKNNLKKSLNNLYERYAESSKNYAKENGNAKIALDNVKKLKQANADNEVRKTQLISDIAKLKSKVLKDKNNNPLTAEQIQNEIDEFEGQLVFEESKYVEACGGEKLTKVLNLDDFGKKCREEFKKNFADPYNKNLNQLRKERDEYEEKAGKIKPFITDTKVLEERLANLSDEEKDLKAKKLQLSKAVEDKKLLLKQYKELSDKKENIIKKLITGLKQKVFNNKESVKQTLQQYYNDRYDAKRKGHNDSDEFVQMYGKLDAAVQLLSGKGEKKPEETWLDAQKRGLRELKEATSHYLTTREGDWWVIIPTTMRKQRLRTANSLKEYADQILKDIELQENSIGKILKQVKEDYKELDKHITANTMFAHIRALDPSKLGQYTDQYVVKEEEAYRQSAEGKMKSAKEGIKNLAAEVNGNPAQKNNKEIHKDAMVGNRPSLDDNKQNKKEDLNRSFSNF